MTGTRSSNFDNSAENTADIFLQIVNIFQYILSVIECDLCAWRDNALITLPS